MEEIETGVEEVPIESDPLGVHDVDSAAMKVLSVPHDEREKW